MMKTWVLILVSLSALASALDLAYADSSVWGQLQSGQAQMQKGLVKSIEIRGSEVIVGLEAKNALGDAQLFTQSLCSDQFYSEEMRASFIRMQVDLLRDARQANREVTFANRGPWSPCLSIIAQ